MAGLDQPSNGDAFLSPGYSVGILEQEPKLNEDKDVLGNVEEGLGEIKHKLDRYNEIAEKMAVEYSDELMNEMSALQEDIEHANAWDLDSQLEQAMDALRCPPPDADVSVLSGGEKRRVALCKLLLSQPDLLLLDEPTNHLDAESVQWLESHLEKYAGTVVAVTHDRYFLDNVAEWILELDRGRAYPYEGNYSTYLETKQARLKVEGRKDEKRAKRLKDELEWVRSNAKGRQAKSKARLERYEEMAAEAEKTRKLDFEEIQIPPGPRLGNVVVEVDNLTKGFDDRVLIDGLSFTLPRNGIVGVIGPNGAGKTTLFKMILGEEQPDSGSIKIGETVKIAYVDQSRGGIDPQEVAVGGRVRRARLHQGRPGRDAVPRLRLGVRLQGPGPAEAGRRAVRRRAQPAEPRADPQAGRQPAAARRADQRPRRRDPVVAGERAARVPRLRGGRLPRPVVPGPGRDPHPRLGGRLAVVLVRGQLRVLREEQGRAARDRRDPAAPRDLPQAHPRLTAAGVMRHRYRCAMRWSDMDAYGHVNNVVYLTYLEEARVDMLFALGGDHGRQGAVRGRPGGAPRDRLQAAARLPPPRRRHRAVGRRHQGRLVRDPLRGARRDEVFATAASVLVPYDLAAARPRRVSPEERAFLEQYLVPQD